MMGPLLYHCVALLILLTALSGRVRQTHAAQDNKTTVEQVIQGSAFATAMEQGNMWNILAQENISRFTVLVPNDLAVARLGEEEVARLLHPDWTAHLQDLLKYHFVDEIFYDLIDKTNSNGGTLTFPTVQGINVTIHSEDFMSNPGEVRTQNGSVVYFVNKVFLPPSMANSLGSLLQKDSRFSTLFELLQLANLEKPLDEVGPVTVFAPTNKAWDALDPALLSSLQNPTYREDLLQILATHSVWEKNVVSKDWNVGDTFEVVMDGEIITVTAVSPLLQLNGTAIVTTPDVLATNGVIQVIDRVILPPNFEIQPRTVSSGTTSSTSRTDLSFLEAEKRLNIVALGDSNIAGNGARGKDGKRDYVDAVCYRSDSSWAGLYSKCIEAESSSTVVRFVNRACSGARVADVYYKQLAGITRKTDLVFLSIGGNDCNVPEAITECYFSQDPTSCKEIVDSGKEILKTGGIQSKIEQLLLDIRASGHEGTKVVLVGPPNPGNDATYELKDDNPNTPNTTYPVGKELYATRDMLETAQRFAVEEANKRLGQNFSVFKSTKDLFRGREYDPRHDATGDEAWMWGLETWETLGFDEENFHFNAKGHAELGNYLCADSDYGSSQPVEEATDGVSKPALLAAMFSILAASLLLLLVAKYLRSVHACTRDKGRCSRKWTDTIHALHRPIRRSMLAAAQRASLHPIFCITVAVIVSFVIMAIGLATNFNIVSSQDDLWMPIGSKSDTEGAWVDSMMMRWPNESTSFGGGRDDEVLLTIVVHKDGENMVSKAGAEKVFEVLDVVRNTPGYSEFCAVHGEESPCPPGYEYICKLYSIPTNGSEEKDCRMVGPSSFWFHNHTLFEQQVASDGDTQSSLSLSLDINLKDVFGYPSYEDGILVSSTAFLTLMSFPTPAEGLEDLRLKIVQALLDLREDWKDEQFKLQFLTTGSFSDEFMRGIEDDIILFPWVFLCMSIFTCIAFAKKDAVQSRSMLGLGAVLTTFLSILTGYGILFTFGVPLTSLTQVFPFIIVGIGLDDSFLLKNAYERSDGSKPVVDRVLDAVDEVGVSIAMTSLTSSLAFTLGCTSTIPAVRWLCLYGVTTILVDFLYQITVFVAMIVLDEKRIASSRRDVFCCFTTESHDTTTDTEPKRSLGARIMIWYSGFLLHPVTKTSVILSFSVLFSVCAIATTRLQLGFNFSSVLPANSYVTAFSDALDEYTQRRINADLFFRDVDQSNIAVQDQMIKYVYELVDGVDAIRDPPIHFWVTDFREWYGEEEKEGTHEEGEPFNVTLQRFIRDPRTQHEGSFILDESGAIVASRSQIAFGGLDIAVNEQVTATMKAQTKVSSEQPINVGSKRRAFFSFNALYYLWEFLLETEKELKVTTIIGVTSMAAMSLFFLPHWSGILFSLPMIISLYVDMLGVLQLAGIDINGVSFVSVVMSLGLYVDYILHVLLCYYESDAPTSGKKVAKMLNTVGASVLLGGLSTFCGSLPLAFTSSEVFHILFVAFAATVVLGLSHGLVLLPVLLALVGPTDSTRCNDKEKQSTCQAAEQCASSLVIPSKDTRCNDQGIELSLSGPTTENQNLEC